VAQRRSRCTAGIPVSFLEDHRGRSSASPPASSRGMWASGAASRAVRMAVTIQAPAERVFDAWSRFEDLPALHADGGRVRPVGEDRWHWVIAGPAGAPIEFDAVRHAARAAAGDRCGPPSRAR